MKHYSADRNTAPATRGASPRTVRLPRPSNDRVAHLAGWALLGLIVWLQPAGLVAADTKHDLAANPAGFLSGALRAWTDLFTLGQLQNQAYGYLFPQGAFFLLTDWAPDWVAQRLWWWLTLGLGFSGMMVMLRRARIGAPAPRALAGLAFALSPRTLTTLTAISSETWPTMLAPWVVAAFLGRLGWRAAAGGVLGVFAMGAVNATATAFACVPGAVVLGWRLLRRDPGAGRAAVGFLVGGCAVCSWWLGPLVVLGRYAPPFMDFIESASVTTRWLNLAEILRGTTSWTPFADVERAAGVMLVSSPAFVIATLGVAGMGLAGLSRLGRGRHATARLWVVMLLLGVVVLGSAGPGGPLAGAVRDFLDGVGTAEGGGVGTALRNLHKADPLVRIPLAVGIAALVARPRAGRAPDSVSGGAKPREWLRRGGALAAVVIAAACAPAWTGRLLPEGAYREVPSYWREAADYVNEHAAGTRTLIVPGASFARQDWGWTRDEPAQPLLAVPWAVRDAIPLIDPEAIRGLDGMLALLDHDPAAAEGALRRAGIGALIVRHDLASEPPVPPLRPTISFGKVDVRILDAEADMHIVDRELPRVSGGGEILPLLDAAASPSSYVLTEDPEEADILTDSPLAVTRNFGTLTGAVSAPLARPDEGGDTGHPSSDYPSAGRRITVAEYGGEVRASSSAAEATTLGGADPARSVTAAVDEDEETAWFPAPGTAAGQWLELRPQARGSAPAPAMEPAAGARVAPTPTTEAAPEVGSAPPPPVTEVSVLTTEDTTVTVSSDGVERDVETRAGTATRVTLPTPPGSPVRLSLRDTNVGIAEAHIAGHPIRRIVALPAAGAGVDEIFVQRIVVDTGVLIREIPLGAPWDGRLESDAEVLIDGVAYSPGDEIRLDAGPHVLRSRGTWARITRGNAPAPRALGEPVAGTVEPQDRERIIVTNRSANPGLRARLGDTELRPVRVDSGIQGFVVPPGAGGRVAVSFAGDRAYRLSLGVGAVVAGLVALCCVFVLLGGAGSAGSAARRMPRRARPDAVRAGRMAPRWGDAASRIVLAGALAGTCWVVAGLPGAIVAGVTAAILRWTVFPPAAVIAATMTAAAAWLARAPWPAHPYAGDSVALQLVLVAALTATACPVFYRRSVARPRAHSAAGRSMNSHDAAATITLTRAVNRNTGRKPPEKC